MAFRRRIFSPTAMAGAAALLALLWSAPARAEPQPWGAVGRIAPSNTPGEGFCTGTLIARDLVLTATHCIARLVDAPPRRVAGIGFAAGQRDGRLLAFSPAAEIIVDPDYEPGTLTITRIPQDVAILRLSRPISVVAPIPVSSLMGFDTSVGIVAYINALPRVPVEQPDCPVSRIGPRLLEVGCIVVGGNSGAALLAGFPDSPRVVGMVSARGGGKAYAAALPGWVFDLVEAR